MSNARIQHVVYVVAMLCMTISCTRTPNHSRDAVAHSNNFVFVATIGGDPKLSAHLHKLLDDQGIESIIEGSAMRGFWITFHPVKQLR